jgi:hypothetical protein
MTRTIDMPRPDAPPDPGSPHEAAALRAEALRQLRWQQQEWQRRLAAHRPGTPCLVAPRERARFHESLDLLRKAGEDVPSWLYRSGSLVRTTDAAGSAAAGVSVVSLLADVTRVLERFDVDHDHD